MMNFWRPAPAQSPAKNVSESVWRRNRTQFTEFELALMEGGHEITQRRFEFLKEIASTR